MRLLKSEPQEVFSGVRDYEEAKAYGSFDLAESSIAVKLGIDLERLDWKDTLQAQIGDKLKTLDPNDSVLFCDVYENMLVILLCIMPLKI